MRIPGVLLLLVLAMGAAAASDDDGLCGLNPDDWCAAPEGDPCGRHTNEAACRADLACFAMPYRGESVVPCLRDERGFASNCPAVGCTSTPPDVE
jgi:hypothetical protein